MKNVIIFITGVVVGAGGMYLFMQKKTEAEIEEQVESIKEAYGKAKDTAEKAQKSFVENMDKVKSDLMNDIIMKKPPSEEDEENYTPYNKAFDNYKSGDVPTESEVVESESEEVVGNIFDQINKIVEGKTHVIDEDTFSTTKLEYGKDELFYNVANQELRDTTGEVQASLATVGEGTIEDCIEEGADVGDVIFVRNDLTEIDYQVNIVEE